MHDTALKALKAASVLAACYLIVVVRTAPEGLPEKAVAVYQFPELIVLSLARRVCRRTEMTQCSGSWSLHWSLRPESQLFSNNVPYQSKRHRNE